MLPCSDSKEKALHTTLILKLTLWPLPRITLHFSYRRLKEKRLPRALAQPKMRFQEKN